MKNALLFLSFLLVFADAKAATVYESHREIIREDETEHFYERTTLQGQDLRIDALNEDGTLSGSHMLSRSNGNNWALVESDQGSCTLWSREQFFTAAAKVSQKTKKLVKADITSIDQIKTSEEAGANMLGLETKHVQVKTNYSGTGKFLFMKRTYAIQETDDLWMTPDWDWPPHEYQWIEAASQTGDAFLDEHESKWLSLVDGALLKHSNTITMTNEKNGKAESKTEHFTVTSLKKVAADSLDPELFTWPNCEAVSDKELEHQATRMLKKYFR
jgi:hypothetical protein